MKSVEEIVKGDKIEKEKMIGEKEQREKIEKIMRYIDIGSKEGEEVMEGKERKMMKGDIDGGYYVKKKVLKGNKKMRILKEEILGKVV